MNTLAPTPDGFPIKSGMERNVRIAVDGQLVAPETQTLKEGTFYADIDCRIGDKAILFREEDVWTRRTLEAAGIKAIFVPPLYLERFPRAALAYALAQLTAD